MGLFLFVSLAPSLSFADAIQSDSVCLSGDKMMNLAKGEGNILFGNGYNIKTQKAPFTAKISMMYNRKTSDWSFIAEYPEQNATCYIEGGENWTKLPMKFPEGVIHGGGFEERIGHCDSLASLSLKLRSHFRKVDIGYGTHLSGSFPPNSGVSKIETHWFIDGVGGWTAVHNITYKGMENAPLACIQAFGTGWKFLDYYETHLPPIGK